MFRYFLLFILFQTPLFSLIAQSDYCSRDTAFHIVVLGSSTAAGTGASPSDSAWVNRYRAHLQSLHPDYQVSNLARGGFTTYRLMPDDFIPPSGRPATDTSRNISKALSLQPDALIINLPSNDVSQGYSVEEQLDNFEILVGTAQAADVPIWVTTTQPKNYGGNPIPIQKQLDVRDSLLQRYAPFVIDFWTGIADPFNELSPVFDSGDGTHLNNRGHEELFERVKATNLPVQLYRPQTSPAYRIGRLSLAELPICGAENLALDVEVYNLGIPGTDSLTVALLWTQIDSLQTALSQITISNDLEACEGDTLQFNINLSTAGHHLLQVYFDDGGIPPPIPERQRLELNILGTPQPILTSDTACIGEQQLLSATAAPGDWMFWYADSLAMPIAGPANSYLTPPLSETTAYYVTASRGDRFYTDTLGTGFNTNVDWNGMMIDLLADTALVLDSIQFKVSDPGQQIIQTYRRMGGHLNAALDASAWTIERRDTFDIQNPESPIMIPFDLTLASGDTLALYFEMDNPAARLTYQRVSDPVFHQADQLQLIATSGISHDFSEVYSPRDFRGNIFYHFGEQPFGDCQSDRIAISAVVAEPEIELGADTTLNVDEQIVLDAGPGFSTYLWSDGSQAQQLLLDGIVLGVSVNEIDVEVYDAWDCRAVDTVTVRFEQLVATQEWTTNDWAVWPNPTKNDWQIQLPIGEWQLHIYDVLGKRRKSLQINCWNNCTSQIDVKDLEKGHYYLEARSSKGAVLGRKLMVF